MSIPFLWENLFKKAHRDDILVLLKRVPIFETLSRRDLTFIEHILHRRTYAGGEHIFREGDVGLGLYIIESGEVAIVSGVSGQEIARLGDGEFFGEIALFEEEKRTAGAVAVRESHVFGFFQPDLVGLLETRPKIGVSVVMRLARIMAERLNRATAEIDRLATRLGELEKQ